MRSADGGEVRNNNLTASSVVEIIADSTIFWTSVGGFLRVQSTQITFTGTRAFSQYIGVNLGTKAIMNACTFTGSFTGPKYVVQQGSVLNTNNSAVPSSLPGLNDGTSVIIDALATEAVLGLMTSVATQFDKTSDTALADITGLSLTLISGSKYRFEAILYTTSNVAGGIKFAIAGNATATAIIYEALVHNAAVLSAQTRATALATTVGAVTAVTVAYARITGTITVNTSGTLTVQFAQNVSSLTASSVLVGSTFNAWPIP